MTENLAHGTHLMALSKNYLMNTNMTGRRWFPYFVCLRVHWAQIAPASEDLTPSHSERTDCLALQYVEKDWTKGLYHVGCSNNFLLDISFSITLIEM